MAHLINHNMSKITIINNNNIDSNTASIELDNDIINNDIDDIDYSKYQEDDSDVESANKFDYYGKGNY